MDPIPTMSVGTNSDQASTRDLEEFLNPDPIVNLAPLMGLDSHPDASLRKAIRNKIKPWRRSIEEPPFTEEQLAIMALADEGKPMTGKAIFCWIMARLPYYLQLACESFWYGPVHCDNRHLYNPIHPSDEGLAGKAHDFRERFSAAFAQFEVPITKITLPDDEWIETSDEVLSNYPQWAIATAEARVLLKPLFLNVTYENGDGFPFLRLPYELRLRIYEMVFAFPRAGIRLYRIKDPHDFTNQAKEMHMVTVTRDLQDLKAKKSWFVQLGLPDELLGSIRCQRPRQLLSLFLVCRNVYEEAMPGFFDINTFVFPSMDELFHFLRPLPEPRCKDVRSILVEFNLYGGMHPLGYMTKDSKAKQLKDRAEILKSCHRACRSRNRCSRSHSWSMVL